MTSRAKHQNGGAAFTLIELLIVVAIIAILAAIAIPNFLEAQTRSKVSRVHSDFRTLATAIEAYAVDYSEYPIEPPRGGDVGRGPIGTYIQLTTPVPYITSVGLRDPFRLNDPSGSMGAHHAIGGDWISYGYVNLPKARGSGTQYPTPPVWLLQSQGPDRMDSGFINPQHGQGTVGAYARIDPKTNYVWCVYDPTNGTLSEGDILRWGP